MKKIFNKICNMIKFGYVSLVGKDDTDYPILQATYLNKTSNVLLITPYGLSSNPPLKTKMLLFNILGSESNKAGIAFSLKNRFKNLKAGEVVVGNIETQSFIKFSENGGIEIESAGKIIINVIGDVDLKANEVNIDATKTNLGTGGARIARLGDAVDVGGNPGTITGAGVNTSI